MSHILRWLFTPSLADNVPPVRPRYVAPSCPFVFLLLLAALSAVPILARAHVRRSPSPPPRTSAPAAPAPAPALVPQVTAPPPVLAPETSPRLQAQAASSGKPMIQRRATQPNSASQDLRMIRCSGGFLHIARQLGKGSFASVYEAWDSSGGQFAVKIIAKDRIAPKYLPLLAGEACALTKLRHPNIVSVTEILDTERNLTFVMHYAGGSDLLEYVNEHGKFSETEAFGFFSQLIAALEHMHKNFFAHRDVKLDNLLLDIKKKQLFLGDFGFALNYMPGVRYREWLGSLSYSAPEILLRRPYEGPELDMWSAGVCLFILVTNTLPFGGKDDQKRSAIAHCSYIIPNYLSNELADLIGSLLTIDPSKRLNARGVRAHPWFATGGGSGIRTVTSTGNQGLRRSSPMAV